MSRNGYWLLGLIAILVIAVGETNAQDFQNITCINQFYHNWQSGVSDVVVDGNYAYLACDGEGLRILNISNPDAIIDISHLAYSGGISLAVADGYAYLDVYPDGIYVIDISNPESPHEVQNIPYSSYVNKMLVDGNYLYVGSFGNGLTIIDVTFPETADIVWQSELIYFVGDLEIHGNTLYTACYNSGLVLWDIANVTSPRISGVYLSPSDDGVTGLAVLGNYAYLTCGWLGFCVVDLSTMQAVATNDSLAYGFDVQIAGNTAYVMYGDPECPLAIVDITNPLLPRTLSTYFPPEDISKFALVGNTVYVADWFHGLRLVDVSDPVNPHEEAVYSRFGHDWDVTVSGNYAFVREDYKLKIIDISDMHNPVEMGCYENDWQVNSFEIAGDIAYVVDHSWDCLHAIDISDPQEPSLISTYNATVDVHYQVAIYDHYAYMTENYGVRILDISNPADIQDAGYYPEYVGNTSIEIYDHYAFVAASTGMLRVFDLTNPTSPENITSYFLGDGCMDLKASNGILYLLTTWELWVFDITNFENWAPLCQVRLFENNNCLQGVDVYGDYIYITDHNLGLNVYDVTDPTTPRSVGYYRTSGTTYGVCALDNIALVADNDNLGFYDCTDAITGIDTDEASIPEHFSLLSNYPNPFNSSTNIQFELSTIGHVQLLVFDALGRLVNTLTDYQMEPGKHLINWNGTDITGQSVASGRYYIRAIAEGRVRNLPILLLK